MTSFTVPFSLKNIDSDTTVMSWDVGSSAAAPTSATFATDVVVSGRERNGPTSGHYGDVLLSQMVTVNMQTATAATSLVALPTGSMLVGIDYILKSNEAATAAADLALALGVSGDTNQHATIAVSGTTPAIMDWTNARYTGVSASLFHSLTAGNARIFAQVTESSGKVTAKDVMLNFKYIRKA